MLNIDIVYYMNKFLYAKDYISYFLTCKNLYSYNREQVFTSYCKDNYLLYDIDNRYASTWKDCAIYYDSNHRKYEYKFVDLDKTLYINMLPTSDIYEMITHIYKKYFNNVPDNIALYLQYRDDNNVKIQKIITIRNDNGEYSRHILNLGKLEKTNEILIMTGDAIVHNINYIINSFEMYISMDKNYKKMAKILLNNTINNMIADKSLNEDKDFQGISDNLKNNKITNDNEIIQHATYMKKFISSNVQEL
ncbi:Hypothetical protein ORPV_586 [Orpheovirus IHUMI-LCC2]|uniref:Uncharacterized protein n=1 Tax=Orpheovirus IHUMI-LCC2 TaxID=2023057 RepID=A0A2I2L4R2_9VIRU|nr:Hypothetical protein ORPV_586 [Orpheovirus IHUMI-LCC2]SNW62490.1 Hypothetical protein ORPV_586 [Orpheovirus IHUMI-LCC2]